MAEKKGANRTSAENGERSAVSSTPDAGWRDWATTPALANRRIFTEFAAPVAWSERQTRRMWAVRLPPVKSWVEQSVLPTHRSESTMNPAAVIAAVAPSRFCFP